MNNEERNIEIKRLKKEKELAEKNLKRYNEELKKHKKGKGFSLFGREESVESDYIEGKINNYKAEIFEIDRKLREYYNDSKVDRIYEIKDKVDDSEADTGTEADKPINRKESNYLNSKKSSIGLIIVIIALFCMAIFIPKDFVGNIISTDNNDEEEIIDEYAGIASDLDDIVSKYDFNGEIETRGSTSNSSSYYCYYIEIGDDSDDDELVVTISDSSKRVEVETCAKNTRAPVRIENEDIKLLTCDLLEYICEKDVIETKDIDSFLERIPKRKYTGEGSYQVELCNYNYALDGWLEYRNYIYENLDNEKERYDTFKVTVYEDE